MGQEICSYCSGSGRDAINPTHQSCWKCHGMGTYWVQDPIKSYEPGSSSSPSGENSSAGHGKQYQMLPWMQRVLDSIPRWLNFLFAVIGSGAGISLAQAVGSSTHSSMALFAAGGFFMGLVFLRLAVVLVDLIIQFTVGLVKIAIVLAIIAGIVYALLQWIGAS